MTNIISIDFDICVWQDIQTYNDSVSSRDGVDRLIKTNPLLNFIRFDAYTYRALTNLILEAKQKIGSENIFFINDHEQILNFLPKDKEFNLYNIDHHHDAGYEEKVTVIPQCGNWVRHAYDKYPMKKYIWVTDDLGINADLETTKKYPISRYKMATFSFSTILPETEKLIICLSPTWMPNSYHPFWHLWEDLLDI